MNEPLPIVVPRREHTLSRRQIAPEALTVLYQLARHGHVAFLAGGGVRDLLIGRRPKDFDVATDATPEQVRKLFRRCRLIGRRFRLAHVLFGNETIEVATFRTTTPVGQPLPETDAATGSDGTRRTAPSFLAHEGMIVRDNQYGTPAEDAVRRDFTVNALFYDIRDYSVIDYVNGLSDLRARLIRSIGDPEIRFVEDPVRMLRAVRFAATLGFTLDPACREAMQRHHARLALANKHRLYDEWLKVMASGALGTMSEMLIDAGLLSVLLPDFAGWVQAVADGRRQRFGNACQWIDERRRRTGSPVPPALAFGVMLGEYFECLTGDRTADGVPWYPAAIDVVDQAMASARLPMVVPRAVIQNVARLIAVQARFQPGRGGGQRFRQQTVFAPALEIFQLFCRLQNRPPEWAGAWTPAADAAPLAAPATDRPVRSGRRRRRRRRPATAPAGNAARIDPSSPVARGGEVKARLKAEKQS